MDWTAGYASDIEYTAGYYQEQSPHYLNFVCALNGMEPVALEQGYTYFELGFGRGLTVNLLAASNPGGRFYAADFNPAHVAGARQLADQAGLDNLTLLENSFAELAGGAVELPSFDFITLHGIYTWVTAENRQHISDFIARYLKPGGVVYVSYNAMPGWTSTLPMQRLLVEWGDAFPNRSDVQLGEATAYLNQLEQAGAAYFKHHPTNQARYEGLSKHNRHYLVHEYMHRHWQPLYHADVARDLAQAKLDYAGSADLPQVYTKLFLSEERQALIAKMPDPAMRETLKDYFLNTSFRKDVFVRGARRVGTVRRIECLRGFGAALTVPRAEIKLKMQLTIGEVNGAGGVFEPVCDALAQRPHTVAELAVLPGLQGRSFEDVVQVVALLTASGQAVLYHGAERATAPAQAMNRALAGMTRYGDDYQALCSPVLGSGLTITYIERLLYALLARNPGTEDVNALASEAWQVLHAQGRQLLKDGQPVTERETTELMLRQHAINLLRDTVPRWRQLQML